MAVTPTEGIGALAFVLLLVSEIRRWTTSILNKRNGRGKARCIDLPRCVSALDNNLLNTTILNDFKVSIKNLELQQTSGT